MSSVERYLKEDRIVREKQEKVGRMQQQDG